MESENVPFVCYNCTTVLQIVFFYLYLYLKPRERQAQINVFRAQYQRLTRRGGGATPGTYGIVRDLSTLVDNFKPRMQILKNKGTVKLIVQTSSVEKIKVKGSVIFQNIFSSMADFRDVVSVLPCSLTNNGKKNLCNLQDQCIYVFPIGGSIYPWNHKIA